MITGLPFHWHPLGVLVVVGLFIQYRAFHPSRRQRREVVVALVGLGIVVLWPVGDLATSVSLSAAVVQRLVIMLLVVPVLMRVTPVGELERWTRPGVVDAVTLRLSHPGLAIVTVTIVGTVTMAPPLIDWGATSWFGHVVVIALTFVAGVVLWIPALGELPGCRRISPAGRAGYLFAASLVVTSLSFVWIFATQPLYPSLKGQEMILGMSPLFDQQLAGFIAKLGAYAPMWVVAFFIFAHAEDEGIAVEETPLHWADVERQLLRVDRQRARASRRQRPNGHPWRQ